jgi:spore coat protein CotF
MSTESTTELTPELMALNKKRFLFGAGLLDKDPDLENPELAASLNEAQAKMATPPADKPPEGEKPKEEPPAEEVPANPPADDTKGAEGEEDKPKEVPAGEEPKGEVIEIEARPAMLGTEDAESIATLAAQKVLEQVQNNKPVDPAPAQVPAGEASLPPEYKRDIAVLRQLEEKNPALKGVADKTLKFYQREASYIEAWEAKNPGMPFDAEADEHQAFYNTMPQVSEEMLEQGRAEYERARLKAEVKAELRQEDAPKEQEAQFKRKLQEVAPAANQQGNSAVIQLVQAVDPTLAKVLVVGDKAVLTEETIAALEKANPAAFEVLNEQAEKVRVMTTELHKLTNMQGAYMPNPAGAIKLVSTDETFYPHAELVNFATSLEGELASCPREKTTREGKLFIRQGELNQRVDSIQQAQNMRPDQKQAAFRDLNNRYWTLGEREIQRALVATYAEKSKIRLKRLGVISDQPAAGGEPSAGQPSPKQGEAQPKPGAAGGAKAPPKPASSGATKRPPTTASASDKINPDGKGAKVDGLTKENLISSMWG